MTSQSNDIAPLRTSSPTPIPETHLHYSAPTTTTRGTQPGHAELDTPPPNTQPAELKRSERTRNLSSRAQAIVARTGKPFVGHSQAPVPEPQPALTEPQSAPTTSNSAPAQAKKPAKRKKPTHRFDGEESGDDDDEGARIKLKPPKRPRRTNTKEHSPPPRRPGHRRSTAGEGAPSQRSVRLDAESIKNIGDVFGLDPKTATSRTINETIRSLSDNRAPQNETSARYTQVRGEPAVPLSSLNKKGGGYYRNKLELLPDPESSTKKRAHSGTDAGSSKRARFDGELNTQDPPDASFPPLPSFLRREPHSVSSTQRAVVHPFQSQRELVCTSLPERAYASQRESTRASQHEPTHTTQSQPTAAPRLKTGRDRFGAGGTPIPEPRGFAALLRAPSPPPPSSTTGPRILVPGTPERTPSPPPAPEKRLPKPIPARKPPAAAASVKKPRPDARAPSARQNEDLDIESELEPIVHPKAKSKSSSSRTASKTSTRHPHSSTRRDPSPAPSTRHGSEDILGRIGDLLNGGDSDDEDNNAVVKSALALLLQHQQQRGQSSSSRQPGLSSSRQPGPSSSRQPGPSSSRQPGSSSSKRHTHRRETDQTDNDEPRRARRDTPSADDHAASEDEYDSPVDCSRSGLGKYPGRRGKVASRAIPGLLSVAARKGVFHDHDINMIWAKKEFIRAWRKRYPDVQCPPPPEDLLCTIVLRISGLRTEVKKRIRAVIKFLFKFRNPGSNEARLEANRKHCGHLLPNTFHCKDLITDKDYYEHKIFIEAICEAFFWHQNSFAVRDPANWQVISLPAVAFVLTMMQDCIQEWDTGCFRVRENNYGAQKDLYIAHLHGLHVYEGEARDRLTDFRSDWFKEGMKHAGVRIDSGDESDHEFCQPVTRACFVRAPTPSESATEPEPEPSPEPSPEPEYVDGRLTAWSKGKGKAPDFDDFSD
ncbi:hypothetical protein FRC12_000549 [Ceratobasidium sp. 428]|nr:hypothetical protein FRC12_000549 [Ceratobasidium sp. 428]